MLFIEDDARLLIYALMHTKAAPISINSYMSIRFQN